MGFVGAHSPAIKYCSISQSNSSSKPAQSNFLEGNGLDTWKPAGSDKDMDRVRDERDRYRSEARTLRSKVDRLEKDNRELKQELSELNARCFQLLDHNLAYQRHIRGCAWRVEVNMLP